MADAVCSRLGTRRRDQDAGRTRGNRPPEEDTAQESARKTKDPQHDTTRNNGRMKTWGIPHKISFVEIARQPIQKG